MSASRSPAHRRRVLRTAVLSGATVASIVGAYYVAPWEGGDRAGLAARVAVSIVIVVVGSALAVRSVLRAEYPLLRATEALIGLTALAIVSFASIYLVLSQRDDTAFSEPLGHTSALYFSMTTATTIGYGDVSARSDPARVVVMLQMIVSLGVVGATGRLIFDAARERTEAR